jgi:hypothetical protein
MSPVTASGERGARLGRQPLVGIGAGPKLNCDQGVGLEFGQQLFEPGDQVIALEPARA